MSKPLEARTMRVGRVGPWIEHFDRATQAPFFENVETGETSWIAAQPRGRSAALQNFLPGPKPIDGWVEHYDSNMGVVYYEELATRVTAWSIPSLPSLSRGVSPHVERVYAELAGVRSSARKSAFALRAANAAAADLREQHRSQQAASREYRAELRRATIALEAEREGKYVELARASEALDAERVKSTTERVAQQRIIKALGAELRAGTAKCTELADHIADQHRSHLAMNAHVAKARALAAAACGEHQLTISHLEKQRGLLKGERAAAQIAAAKHSDATEMAGLQYARQLFKLTDARFADLHKSLIVAGVMSEGDDDTIDKVTFVTTAILHLLSDATPAQRARAKEILESVFDFFVEYTTHIIGDSGVGKSCVAKRAPRLSSRPSRSDFSK